MNTSSRVPGITRNSGWLFVDAEIDAHGLRHQPFQPSPGSADVDPQRGRAVVEAHHPDQRHGQLLPRELASGERSHTVGAATG